MKMGICISKEEAIRHRKMYWRDMPYSALYMAERRCKDIALYPNSILNEGDSLKDILTRDETTLYQRRITHTQIGDKLKEMKNLAKNNLEEHNTCSPTSEGMYEVTMQTWKGSQRSPFQHYRDDTDYICCRDIQVVRMIDGKVIRFSDLMIEMIKYNGFFQNGKHRLSPEELISFFSLEANLLE
jgi:hypothetical protein